MLYSVTRKSPLSKIRQVFWPIKKEELKLFLPISLMMFCILFNFGVLRSIKDALIVPSIGAEVISVLKFWFVLPFSILFTIIYVKLSNTFKAETLFYIIVSSFLAVIIIFTYVIYPNQAFFHPTDDSVSLLIKSFPNLKWVFKILGKWSYAIMYLFCELWSVVVINLMFWQFANQIFDTEKAKRFYPVLGMVGNLGLVLAGNVLVTCFSLSEDSCGLDLQVQSEIMLKPIILAVVFSGTTAMIIFKVINSLILKDKTIRQKLYRVTENTKTKLSVIDSFKLIFQSKYIGHIVLLIVCYGLLINVLEGPWKAKIRELYPNTIEYAKFMGQFNIWMGISCVTFMFIGSNVLRRMSWLTSALFTPVMLSITGIIFFIFVIMIDKSKLLEYGFNPLYAAVFVGAIQNILSKSTKYSLFDSTKEMAYIPLSLELRTKGKAAVEIVGIKLGKASGAFLQSTVFLLIPSATFESITVLLFVVFILVLIVWFWDIVKLNHAYLAINKSEHK